MDSIITKDIKRYTKGNDVTESDAIIDEQIAMGYAILKPYRDKMIGWGMGNHEESVLKYHGTDPTQRMADLLGTKHLGYSGLLRLILSEMMSLNSHMRSNLGKPTFFFMAMFIAERDGKLIA